MPLVSGSRDPSFTTTGPITRNVPSRGSLQAVRLGVWHGNVKEFYSLPLDDGPYVFREGGKLRIADYEFVPPQLHHWSRVIRGAWFQQLDGSYRVHEEILELTNQTALDHAIARHPVLDLDLASPPQPQAAVYAADRVAARRSDGTRQPL